MKGGIAFLLTMIFLVLTAFGANITMQALMNRNLLDVSSLINQDKAGVKLNASRCDPNKLMLLGLDKSNDPEIQKLYEYQQVCDSFATNRVAIYTNMPKDKLGAQRMAEDMSKTLREYANLKISPIVIVQPVTDWGKVDFVDFRDGVYDSWVDEYFKTLKLQGINDEDMGLWIPFPIPNSNVWNRGSTTPADFGTIVNRYVSTMKKYFPNSQAGILLNSLTYTQGNFDWNNGEYLSLVPYVQNINKGTISSVGLEGFPWIPAADELKKNKNLKSRTNPEEYLNFRLVTDAAYALNVKDVWFNTGTFSSMYSNNSDGIVFMTPEERKAMLDKVLAQAQKAKDRGYNVWINLYAEDRSNTDAGVDWSYWQDYKEKDNLNRFVLSDFISKVYKSGLGLSIYDQTEEVKNADAVNK